MIYFHCGSFSCLFVLQERRLAAVRELVRLLKPGGRALIYVWAFEQEYNKLKSKYLKDQKKEHHGNQVIADNASEDSQEAQGESSTRLVQRTEGNTHNVLSGTDSKLSIHTNRTAFNTQDLLVPWHLKGGKKQGEKESGEGVKKEKRKERTRKSSGNLSSASSLSSTDRIDCNPDARQDFDSDIPSGSSQNTSNTSHNTDSELQSTTSKSESENGSPPIFHRYYHVFQQGELEQLCGLVSGVKVQSSYHDQGNWCVILEKVD